MPVVTTSSSGAALVSTTPAPPSSGNVPVQCDPSGRNIEWWNWQTPDGVNFKLHNIGTVFTLTEQGAGFAPTEYITERRAFQDGETVVDVLIKPRVIQLLIRVVCRSRSDYWNRRAQLVDMTRPNRTLNSGSGQPPSPGTLTYQLPNRDSLDHPIQRSIACYLQKGLDFQPRSGDKWDEWAIQEMLQFSAPNPLFYNPKQQSLVITPSGAGLVFPITFPITFGGITGNFNLTYSGTWREYPVIKITGPVVSPVIENTTTGETIGLNYTVLAGHTVTIDLSQSGKPVTLDDGTSLSKFITSAADLATWHLEPNPGAPSGVNVLNVVGSGTSGQTSITINWFERFFGI